MKLSITILSCLDNVFKASIQAEGLTAPASVNFNPRSGSVKSHIANLPKSLVELGSATNITIPTTELVVGATLVKDSVKGSKSVMGTRNISGAGFIPRYGMNDAGHFELFEVAPNGDKRTNLIVKDPAVAVAFKQAQKFLEYMEKLSAHAKDLKDYEDRKSAIAGKQLTVRNVLKGLKSDDEIDAIVTSMAFTEEAPVMPTWDAPDTPDTPETPESND